MAHIFRLRVQARRDKALIRVERSSKGRPRQRYQVPFSDEQQSFLLNWFEEESLRERDEAALLAVEVGQNLYKTLLPEHPRKRGNIRRVFDQAMAEASHSGLPLTLQVRFDPETVPQAQLPWELLHNTVRHLVFDESVHFNRYITFYGDRKPFKPVDKLNILYVISRPVDLEHLDHYVEKSVVAQAFMDKINEAEVTIDVLEESTFQAFQKLLKEREYHVVHWDGHGGFPQAASEGILAFETPQEQTDRISASQFADALRGTDVRLVVLSACQSGTLRGNHVLNSVGPALIRSRVPAVVAMQFSVPLTSTVNFSAEFYQSLARGESVAAAVADGRKAMSEPWKTWFYPALYLRAAEGEGFLFSAEPAEHFAERQLDLAQLSAEWRSMPEPDRRQFDEGPPNVTDLYDDADELEEFIELVEELMDTIEDVQDMIDTIDDFLEAIDDADDPDDDGGDSSDDDPDSDQPGEDADDASDQQSFDQTGADADDDSPTQSDAQSETQGLSDSIPIKAQVAADRFAALLEGQGLMTIEGSLGAQYAIQPVSGGWGGGGAGDGTHALQAGTYTIMIGQHEAGRATVEERKETTIQLDIALAHIKLAYEGAGYTIIDAATQQFIGSLTVSWDWHLKPGSYEVHFGQQGIIASFAVGPGDEVDVSVDGALAHIKLAFEGAGYTVIDATTRQFIGSLTVSWDWHLKPGSYEVYLGQQSLITSFTVGPRDEVDVSVDGALAHIKLAFEGAGYTVLDATTRQFIGSLTTSWDWHLKPGSYEVHFGQQGMITSFAVAARQETEVPVQGGLVHIQSVRPDGYSVVDAATQQFIGSLTVSWDWHLKPGTYQIRRPSTEPPHYVVTATFAVGQGQETSASG